MQSDLSKFYGCGAFEVINISSETGFSYLVVKTHLSYAP